MIRLLTILAILALPLQSQAYTLEECNSACAQLFPGGPVVPPVTPPTGKTCPMPITFERDSDQGGGAAAILFRTLQAGSIVAVSVNGEVARLGKPYRNSPVFLMSKSGDQYARPLKFIVQAADGQVCTATSGSSDTPAGPATPTGGYKYSKTYDSYGIRNSRQAWRIPAAGPSFGKQIKFVFSSGKEFTVKDTEWNCRDREDTCKRDSRSENYGFVYKPGGPYPNGDGDADRGTSHKGIYLHSPHGDNSKTVKLLYNGK